MPRISIITAFLNEAENLPEFKRRVLAAVSDLPDGYEIVLVDDHSTDRGASFARSWAATEANVQYVRLSRNCGSHAAFSAGLAVCRGDCAVLLAADLQDPPEVIGQLIEQWEQQFDVVWAARAERRGERWSTRLCAAAYYAVMRRLGLPEMPRGGADFLLMDRKVIDAYNAIPEKNTSFLALVLWMGFRQTSIEYAKHTRRAGVSKWTLAKKIKLFVDSVVSFSYTPIRAASGLGLLISLIAFAMAVQVIYNALRGNPVAGYSSVMVVVLGLGGLQLLMLGILGEYLWRAFDQARGRPWYIVEEHLPHCLPGKASEAEDPPQSERQLPPLPHFDHHTLVNHEHAESQ